MELEEEKRKQLDGIVQNMIQNRESDGNIQLVVEDFKNKYGTIGTITKGAPWWMRNIVKPTMEYGGLAGGGAVSLLAGPAAPYAAPFTAGGGYALGKGLYGLAEELFYGSREPGKPEPSMLGTMQDIGYGGAMEAGGQIGGKIITKSIGKVLAPYGEKAAGPQAQELKRIYKEFDIKPFPSEIVPEQKSLSLLESVLGYRPISGDVMIREATKKLDTMHAVREQLIAKSAPSQDVEMVGNLIRKEAKDILSKYTQAKGDKLQTLTDNFVQKFGVSTRYRAGEKFVDVMGTDRLARQEQIKEMYENITEQLPQKGRDVVQLSPDTKSLAKKLLREEQSKLPGLRNNEIINLLGPVAKEPKLPEGVTSEMLQKDPILKQLVESKLPKTTWEGLKNSRSDLLERVRLINKAQGEATKESRVYSELAQAIDEDMGKYAREVGGNVWGDFLKARESVKTMHELYDKDLLKIMNRPVEDILGRIVKGGEVTLLKQIKASTGQAGLEPLRQGFFGEVIKQATRGGEVNPKIIMNIITKPEMQETLFELGTPQQINILRNIAQKGLHFTNITKGMKTVDFLETIAGGSNEGIMNYIFKPGNRENIILAKKLLSPERLKQIESLGIEKVLVQSKGGFYLPVSSAGQAQKYAIPLKELLEPAKYQKLTDFIKLGQNMTRVEQLAKNASQTGQVLLGSQIGARLLQRPDKALQTLGIPYVISKIYTSDLALNYFTNAMKLPVNSDLAVSNFIKAWIVISKDIAEEKKVE